MKLSVNSKNEYYFYPDVADNLEKEEKERFTIVVKKINPALIGTDVYIYNDNNEFVGVNNAIRLKSHVKELRNPPILQVDGVEERELTIEDLFSDNYTELYSIVLELNMFIHKLNTEEEFETKKF